MSINARTVASTPERLPGATWEVIADLLAPDSNSPAAAELRRVHGVASMLIASESMVDDPALVSGGALSARVYCVHGDAAVDGDGVNEEPFAKSPTDGDWQLSLPCPENDLPWVREELAAQSKRVTARATGTGAVPGKTEGAAAKGSLQISREEFFKS